MANGKVCTGFSKPYVAVLGSTGYTDGQILARGVEVSIEPESSDPENFTQTISLLKQLAASSQVELAH